MKDTEKLLAEVKISKLKDCPILTAGQVDPIVLQNWTLACKRYMKHAGKKASEIVSFVAEGMMEPRLVAWYNADQDRIDKLSLAEYIKELASLVLEKNWDAKIRQKILASKQGSRAFIDWKIEVENLNSILTTSAPTYALQPAALRNQLEANLNEDLLQNLLNEPTISTELAAWTLEVKERDDRMKAEDRRTQKLIQANDAAKNARRTERKNFNHTSETNNMNTIKDKARKNLPKLTDQERELLNKHEGCTRCRRFYTGHRAVECPMTTTKTWPDAETYIPLTEAIARAAKPQSNASVRIAAAFVNSGARDDDTDSYVPPPENPFTTPHLYAMLDISGTSVEEPSLSVKALLDIGCPAVMISAELVKQLGLKCFDLPPEEDNLLSLSDTPLKCREYVKLRVGSGNGAWGSGITRAKVYKGLPISLILGMPFLASENIVIDAASRTAIDKRTNYDLIRPRAQCNKPKGLGPHDIQRVEAPALAGYLLPEPIMAAVRERIEVLADELLMNEKNIEFKRRYADRFPARLSDTADLPTHIYHRIRLKDINKVTKNRGYAAPKKYHDAWKKLLDEHLAAGRIRPSSSEYSSPAFCVPKYLDGIANLAVDPRWVNDYRELNVNTVRDRYPLPLVQEILADCGNGKIFAKIDMTNSFFQTRVHPDDIHLTAIRTPWGLFEWTVMPMGGCNAPATHQRRMNDALREHIGRICQVYMDDIVIWSQTIEEHEQNVAKVLEALQAAQLICNPKKSVLFAREISFLGHVISANGVRADPRKIDRVLDWPTPTTAKNVRGFLGLTRYLAAFIPRLAEYTSVLTPLTMKECDVEFPPWTENHQIAFDKIKELVTGIDCLTVIDYNHPTGKIFLTTDASDRRTGAVLSFGDTWETARPVAFESYQLNDAEKNYPVHEKELLAIVKALKKWRSSLLGTKFEIYTDHRTLEYFHSQKEMSRRQMRWSMYMADFEYDIIYIRGEDNSVADALSRMPDAPPTAALAACALANTRNPLQAKETAAATILQITTDKEILARILDGYSQDEFCKKVKADIAAGSIEGARCENDLLYVGKRLLIPQDTELREMLYNLAHDTLGHFGFDKSYEALRDSYYWPNMRRDLEKAYIPACVECQRNKDRTTKPRGPLHPLPVPDGRFESIGINFVGPLPEENGKDTIMTMTDLLGADVRIAAVHSSYTAAQIAVVLFDEWYCENGLMTQIVSDRDALFTAEVWKALHKLTGVKLKMSTAYHPETDGGSERTNKTINQAIRYHVDINQKGWLAQLPRVRFAIMNTINSLTGFSPFQLKTGRSPRLIPPIIPIPAGASADQITAQEIVERLQTDVKEAQDNLLAAKIRQAYHANEHRGPEEIYKVGDLVMLSTTNRRRNYKRKGKKRVAKFMPRHDGPYTITAAFPEKSEYTLRLPNNATTFPGFHASLLKRFIPNDPTLFPSREFTRPPPILTEDGTEENLVDKIVDARRRGRGKQYLVRWVGYGKDHDEWLSGKELEKNEALDRWERENGTDV